MTSRSVVHCSKNCWLVSFCPNTYASLPSSRTIAQKVEESRKARQRLAALLNLDKAGELVV